MNESNDNKLKEELDRIELPDDSKQTVLDRIRAAGEEAAPEPVLRKKYPVRRVILIAAAVTVLAALAVGLFIWMRPSDPPVNTDPSTSETDNSITDPSKTETPEPIVISTAEGEDWVKDLFEREESAENGSGTIRDTDSSSLYDSPTASDMYVGWSKRDDVAETELLPEEPTGADYWEEPKAVTDGTGHWAKEGGTGIEGPSIGNGERISAGTLTAGRRDDNALFKEFLQEMEELKEYGASWRLYPKKRIAVQVDGCPNALTALIDADGTVLSYARTNVNGFAYLYYDLYTDQEQTVPHKIGISSGNAFGEYILDGSENGFVSLKLENAPQSSDKLDVLIMLDTTGSMGDEITYLQAEIEDVMTRVKAEAGNARVRLSVNFYRDRGDTYTVRYNPFTEDIAECKKLLAAEYADGGGDFPEAVDEALVNAVCDHAWDEDAVKVMFLVLDAPPHDEDERQGTRSNIRKALESAQKQGIRIVPVVASGIDDTTEYLMRSLAAATGGVYAFLTDHSGIGNAHADPHVEQYSVEKLNDLMVNVILSYWKADPNAILTPDPVSDDPVSDDPVSDDPVSGGSVAYEPADYPIRLTGEYTDLVIDCPGGAKEGDTVEIRTQVLYDADLHVFVDGESIPQTAAEPDYWAYSFTMPDHEVTVRLDVVENVVYPPEVSGEESGGEVILPVLPIG